MDANSNEIFQVGTGLISFTQLGIFKFYCSARSDEITFFQPDPKYNPQLLYFCKLVSYNVTMEGREEGKQKEFQREI